jgi:2',3'-cyclic-nucleotide 2'-phosphodiesterase (5'-nucleotidase family)
MLQSSPGGEKERNETLMKRAYTAISLALTVLAGTLVCGCGEKPAGGEPEKASVTLIYSSDMLGKIRSCGCTVEDSGGLGRRATYTERARSGPNEVLVLDAGDAFSLDLSFTKKEAELTMASFSLIGVDVFTPGETEFIFGLPFLMAEADNADFKMIAANIVDPGTGEPVFGTDYTVITLEGGLRIAVTGVLDETIKFPAYIDRSGFRVLPAEETLKKIIPRMKKDADFLVLLSHMGVDRTRDMLQRVRDLDIVVVGHDRPMMKNAEKVGKTLMLGTGGLGQYLGRVDMELSPSGRMEYGRLRLIPLPDDIPIHPGIREIFRAYGVPITDKEAGVH